MALSKGEATVWDNSRIQNVCSTSTPQECGLDLIAEKAVEERKVKYPVTGSELIDLSPIVI